MYACKRLETFNCTITAIRGGTQTVEIQPSAFRPLTSGIRPPPSALKLAGGKIDQIRIGSIIKVEGFGLTAAGKIRGSVLI